MYAAPEVLEGLYHSSTDCFSVGVILFILLVSVPPFTTETRQAYLREVYSGDWRRSAGIAGASSVVQDLLAGLLEPDYTLRGNGMSTLRHRWVADKGYAEAADRMHAAWISELSERGDYSLRFLSACGTAAGGPSSLSLSPSTCKFDAISEEVDDEESFHVELASPSAQNQ